jgi:ferric-dicitrate binding protein FerR (iron transport regulator)
MYSTKTIATLIVRQYKNGETLTASQNNKLENWKSQSCENEELLNKLAAIFGAKGELPMRPPTEISVIVFKEATNMTGPLTDAERDKLNNWRALSPENEALYRRLITPNGALASINIKKERRKIAWMTFKALLRGRIRNWLGDSHPVRPKQRISKQTVALVQTVLASRKDGKCS